MDLEPDTLYKLRLSASTVNGEGERSVQIPFQTDYAPPLPPQISNISYVCGDSAKALHLEWTSPSNLSKPMEDKEKYLYEIVIDSNSGRLTLNSSQNMVMVDSIFL